MKVDNDLKVLRVRSMPALFVHFWWPMQMLVFIPSCIAILLPFMVPVGNPGLVMSIGVSIFVAFLAFGIDRLYRIGITRAVELSSSTIIVSRIFWTIPTCKVQASHIKKLVFVTVRGWRRVEIYCDDGWMTMAWAHELLTDDWIQFSEYCHKLQAPKEYIDDWTGRRIFPIYKHNKR